MAAGTGGVILDGAFKKVKEAIEAIRKEIKNRKIELEAKFDAKSGYFHIFLIKTKFLNNLTNQT